MKILHSLLPTWQLAGKRVLLRADLNVPLLDTHIVNDYRLKALQPTLDYILKHQGKVILISHVGRPEGFDPHLSTKLLIPWFIKHGYTIDFASTLEQAQEKSFAPTAQIVLVENMRFFPGEKSQDSSFAQHLAKLGDYYVNDAFGTLHRADSSMAITPRFFPTDKKTIGFLVEKELQALQRLKNPEPPFLIIVGGSKTADKVPILEHFLVHQPQIALCPAIVFTFLKAQEIVVGNSLVDAQAIPACKRLIKKAPIIIPQDYLVATDTTLTTFKIIEGTAIAMPYVGIAIGPKTCTYYTTLINQAKTILFNGIMGFLDKPETLESTYALLNALAQSSAYTVIGGGDSIAAAQSLGITSKIGHVSTGGGSLLSYIGNKELPGLTALL